MDRRIPVLTVAAFVLVWHLALALQWWRVDRQPPPWDPAVHLGTAMDYRDAWRDGRWLDLLRTVPRPGHPQYPIAYDYTLIPLLSGEAPHRAVVFLNLAYLFILIGSAGWLAWLCAGPWAAAAALLATGLSPGLLYKFREAFPDLALAAWTTLAYALVVRSKGFEDRRWRIPLGLCGGLALLSKWGAALYLLPAVCWGLRSRQTRRNLAAALALCAALALPWYVVNVPTMLPRIWTSVTLGTKQGSPTMWTAANWLTYPGVLIDCYGLAACLLFLAGAARALRAGEPRRLLLASWLAFSYLFCTLVPSKDPRYFLPAAAALPVVGVAGLTAPALALSAVLAAWQARNYRRPDPSVWPVDEILAETEARRGGRTVSLCLLANHMALNNTTFSYAARRRGLDRVYLGGIQNEIPEWADFVLVKTGDPGPFIADSTRSILASARDPRSLFSDVFRPARRWPLPDGSEAVLYEQRPDLRWLSGTRRYPALPVRSGVLRGVTLKSSGPGRYEVSADSLELEKLSAPVRGIRVELSGARLIERDGKIHILGLERLRLLSARQDGRELSLALTRRSGIPVALEFEGGQVRATARLAGLPVLRATILLTAQSADIAVKLNSAAFFGIPLPRLSIHRSLEARPPWQPYSLELAPLLLTREGPRIGT